MLPPPRLTAATIIDLIMKWYEQEEFWSTFYDWMFPAESFEEAALEVDSIVRLAGVGQGALLDLCCGPGRHSVPFARNGYAVTGVDLQPLLIDKAREYAGREGVAVEFVRQDMETFQRPDAFDLAISMFSSFGYFSQPEADFQVLKNVHCSLRSSGLFVMDLRGKEIHAMENATSYAEEMANGDMVFHLSEVSDDWTSVLSTWVQVRDARARSFRLNYNLYSGVELRGLLLRAGFRDVRLYGSLVGTPYNQKAKRLVAVAAK